VWRFRRSHRICPIHRRTVAAVEKRLGLLELLEDSRDPVLGYPGAGCDLAIRHGSTRVRDLGDREVAHRAVVGGEPAETLPGAPGFGGDETAP
jgi:hypothetical protein